MLRFSPANAKTKALYDADGVRQFLGKHKRVYSLDMLSGHSCPGARDCFSKVVERQDAPGKFTVQDGPHCQFRCFAASQEARYPSVRQRRTHNFHALQKMRGVEQCRSLLEQSLPSDCGVLRFHVGGDFFKLHYLQGALELADSMPNVLFYAYTKVLKYFVSDVELFDAPNGIVNKRGNFLLTASRGGKYDNLIEELRLREARVVFSESEAGSMPIDHDDSHAATVGGSFALLLHGTQPKGSEAAKALRQLNGKGSYGRGNK